MLRVLLASADQALMAAVKRHLDEACIVESCTDGDRAMDFLISLDPDVLVIDTELEGTDCVTVIRSARATGRSLAIMTVTSQCNPRVIQLLQDVHADFILGKPCVPGAVASHIIAMGASVKYPDRKVRRIEDELDSVLVDLGFRMGPGAYYLVKIAVLKYYYAEEKPRMKELYYTLNRQCGGSSTQKEKAIRDGIKKAWERGDKRIWKLYFPDLEDECPGTETFLTKLTLKLDAQGRQKLAYVRTCDR